MMPIVKGLILLVYYYPGRWIIERFVLSLRAGRPVTIRELGSHGVPGTDVTRITFHLLAVTLTIAAWWVLLPLLVGRLASFLTFVGLAMGGASWWYANRLATTTWPQRQSSLQDNREQPPQHEPIGIRQTQAVTVPAHESNSTPAPGWTKFAGALALVASTDEISETTEKELITLLDEALRLGLNSLDTVRARIMRGFARFSLAMLGTFPDDDSRLASHWVREAVAEIEAAVDDDRLTKAGNFSTWGGRHLGDWHRLDAYYAYHARKIHDVDGPHAAIKFLEEKLSSFSHSPVPMLPGCWNELGTYYAKINARMRAKEAFEAAIRAEGYEGEIADDIKAMARRNLSRERGEALP